MDLPTRLAAWRRAKGLTQSAVAKACDVTTSAISYWESGATSPTQDNLEKFVALLGIGMARFYGRVPKAKAAA